MLITHINDIPINEFPVFNSMVNNTLVRFSKWECAKYWERRGFNYNDILVIYDRYITKINTINKINSTTYS